MTRAFFESSMAASKVIVGLATTDGMPIIPV